MDRVKLIGRAEYRHLEYTSRSPVETEERIILGAQVNWDVRSNLAVRVRQEYELDIDVNDNENVRDEFLIRANYKVRNNFSLLGYYRIEHDEIDQKPLLSTKTTTTTWLFGTKYRLTPKIDFSDSHFLYCHLPAHELLANGEA